MINDIDQNIELVHLSNVLIKPKFFVSFALQTGQDKAQSRSVDTTDAYVVILFVKSSYGQCLVYVCVCLLHAVSCVFSLCLCVFVACCFYTNNNVHNNNVHNPIQLSQSE